MGWEDMIFSQDTGWLASRMRNASVQLLAVFTLHLLLAAIATYPMILNLDTALVGDGDTVQNLWNLWHTRSAFAQGHLFPFYTRLIYHPDGVSLAYHSLSLLNGWLGITLQNGLGLGLVSTYNWITLLTFVLSGAGVFLLLRTMRASCAAAFCASVVFTFAPIRLSRVHFGNLDMYSTQFVPLAVLFCYRFLQTGKAKYAALGGMMLAATTWLNLYLAVGAALFCALLFGAARFLFLYPLPSKRLALGLMAFAGLTCVLALPVVLPMVQDFPDFAQHANQTVAAVSNSADLAGFFIPDASVPPLWLQTLGSLKDRIAQVYQRFYGNPCEKTVFIGYAVLGMAIFSVVVVRDRRVWFWLAIAGLFALLCLGPQLHFLGKPLFRCMPYSVLSHLPLVNFGRAPSRLAIFVMLALAILIGHALTQLEARQPLFKQVALVLSGITFVENLIVPMRLDFRVSQIPAYYAELSRSVTRSAILDVPVDLVGAQGPGGNYMLYQTVHQQPIVGGYISRTPSKDLWPFDYPFIHELRARIYGDTSPYQLGEDILSGARSELASLGVQYVIVHRDEFAHVMDYQTVREGLSQVLGVPTHEDGLLTVWDLDNVE
jgi:hypothetical protein